MYSTARDSQLTQLLLKVRLILTWGTLSLTIALAKPHLAGAQHPQTTGSKYQVVHGWPQLPEGTILGQVSGVGVDSHNHVFVFRRAENSVLSGKPNPNPIASPAVLMFDGATGALLSAWGEKRFILPHGLAVDRQDNIWLTDIALHQVFKFDHAGKLLLTLGESGVAGLDGLHFNKPTDVAVANDNSFYVSDGYGNSRVVKFSAEGRFVLDWGTKGTSPGQFDLPHGIALDSSGKVYVADRSNRRLQIFDSNGKYLDEWKGSELGRPWAVRMGPDGYLYIVDGGDLPSALPDRARVLIVDLKGKIFDSFGRFGNYDGQFVWPHDLAIGKDNAVYVGDVSTGMRVQKFVKSSTTARLLLDPLEQHLNQWIEAHR
jgi:peptidylamidoglycolate lyase